MENLHLISNYFRKHTFVLLLIFFSFMILQVPIVLAESIVEGAKREGKVLCYIGSSVIVVQALANSFNKRYPFIKVEHYKAPLSVFLEKLIMEKRSGKAFCDVVHMNGIWPNVYKKEGLLRKYVSPESKVFPNEFKDPEGFWTAFFNGYYAFLYNTRLLAKTELPKNYDDLLNPKWRGKIGLHTDELEWYMGTLKLLGEEKGRQFMKRLSDQDLVIRTGRTLLTTIMVAGEFPLTLGLIHRMLEMQKVGAPVDRLPFTTPTLAAMRCIAISANAPHPNASTLFVDFILSKEGQSILNQYSQHPVRMDVKVDPVVEAIRHNLFPIGPGNPELIPTYKKEYETILLKQRRKL